MFVISAIRGLTFYGNINALIAATFVTTPIVTNTLRMLLNVQSVRDCVAPNTVSRGIKQRFNRTKANILCVKRDSTAVNVNV